MLSENETVYKTCKGERTSETSEPFDDSRDQKKDQGKSFDVINKINTRFLEGRQIQDNLKDEPHVKVRSCGFKDSQLKV